MTSQSGVQLRFALVLCGKFSCLDHYLAYVNLFPSACLPTLRLLLVRLFPVLGGSSARSRQQYYNYGSGNELRNVSQKQKSYNVNTAVSSPRTESFDDKIEDGIRVKTSYMVKHSHSGGDTDEASLVSYEGQQRR
jgi:hypothetical protein